MNTELKTLLVREIPVAVETMTSLEIVKLINMKRELDGALANLRHDNFMLKVPQVLGRGGVLAHKDSYFNSQNKKQPCFKFPKREAMLMLMSYDYDLQAAVYDRMTELEEAVKNPHHQKLPTDYVSALECLIESEKSRQAAMMKIEQDRPKVESFDSFMDSEGLMNATQVGHTMGISAKELNAKIDDLVIPRGVYNKSVIRTKAFNQWFIDNRYGVSKVSERGFTQALFTPKGVEWVNRQIGYLEKKKTKKIDNVFAALFTS